MNRSVFAKMAVNNYRIKQKRCPRATVGYCALLPMMWLAGVSAGEIEAKTDLLEQAIELRQQGRVYDSIEMLERLKAKDSSDVRVNLELAISYLKSNQFRRAEDAVEFIFSLAPTMKDNKKLLKLKTLISQSEQKAMASQHSFKAEITGYKGYEQITSQFPYFEITEYDDYYQVERKEDTIVSKYYYTGARVKGEYRYTPTQSFNLFGLPVYSFWINRLTYFYKESDTLDKVHFDYTSVDSSFFVIQPKQWAFNAKVKGKWNTFEGRQFLTEQSIDVNGSMLFHGARVKLGVSYKDDELNKHYADELYDDTGFIYEQDTHIAGPYLEVSYRFSPNLLWSLGTRRRNIHASNELLGSHITNYNSTIKYSVTENWDLYWSYFHDDLRYNIIDLEQGLNSGELKRTFSFGTGYGITDHWQIGLNALYVDKKQDDDYGQDQWKRVEGYVRYRF